MVRVLACHHFSSKDVVATSHEPRTFCATENWLFIPTSHGFIEVYAFLEKGFPQMYRFPSVGIVKEIVYSAADDYIATLEDNKASNDVAVRVYLNWKADLKQHPMSVRVAGHMTSLRHSPENISPDAQPQVVEVPLKGAPTCLAADNKTGNFAVGVGKSLLLYGLCCKTDAGSEKIYEEIKCLLEIQFKFNVKYVAICEEFLAAASVCEFQVVQLNMDRLPVTITKDINPDFEKLVMKQNQQDFRKTVSKDHLQTSFKDSKTSAQMKPSKLSSQSTYIVEDKHHFTLNLVTMTTVDTSTGESHVLKQKWLKGINEQLTAEKRKLMSGLSKGELLLGPLPSSHRSCPVTVEYEDTCGCGDDQDAGVLERGVTTCLHQRMPPMSSIITAPQLVPIYTSEKSYLEEDRSNGRDTFTSGQRSCLSAVHCIISTNNTGYLYEVFKQIRSIATYPFTAIATQVVLHEGLVYTISSKGLEVYTSRAVPNATTLPDEDVLPLDLEPCLIALEPFVSLNQIAVTANHVCLLSRHEENWSIYILKKPTVPQLCSDMLELAQAYVKSNKPTYGHLVQEAYLILSQHLLLRDKQTQLTDIVSEVALKMGDLFVSDPVKSESCVYYYKQSLMKVDELIEHVQANNKGHGSIPAGLICFLKDTFMKDDVTDIDKPTGDKILQIFAESCAEELGTILLASRLYLHVNQDAAVKLLKKRLNAINMTKTKVQYDALTMALALVYMSHGQLAEAEFHLHSLSKESLKSLCKKFPAVIFTMDPLEFTPLAQLLRKHDPRALIEVLVYTYDEGCIQLDKAMELLRMDVDSGGDSVNVHLCCFLELLFTRKNRSEEAVKEIVEALLPLYITQLLKPAMLQSSSVSLVMYNTLVKESGYFVKRHSWLDYLPPYEGQESMHQLCLYKSTLPASRNASPLWDQSGQASVPARRIVNIDSDCKRAGDMCICINCTATLIKLQSLLCCPDSYIIALALESKLPNLADISGYVSLEILCKMHMKWEAAVDLILTDHSNLLQQVLCETYNTNINVWKYCSNQLFNAVTDVSTPNGGSSANMCVLKDILEELATRVSPEEMHELLPTNGDLNFYIQFLEKSEENLRLKDLKESIVSHAEALANV